MFGEVGHDAGRTREVQPVRRDRISDVATGAVGGATGTVVEPGEGLRRAASRVNGPVLAAVTAAALVGFLLGRRKHR